MQEDNHIFQGLKRDIHQIRQEAKFLWDAHNIRLTNRDRSTLFSITNEKGTADTKVSLNGYYVGHCVLNKYLVVFTSDDDGGNNYIYRIENTDNGYNVVILFHEPNIWDKGWSPYNPIETIGVYETNLVQKVYWVDGVNQPRIINIAKPELKIPHKYIVNGADFQTPDNNGEEFKEYLKTNFPDGLYLKDSFDFVRELSLKETVKVDKIYGQGEFSPGTVQYAFSYYDKYMQESNIWYTTQLYYVSFKDRGGNPDEKVPNSFRIEISNPDPKFEYIRIYSIHRTSIDAVPTVKIVEDVLVSSKSNNVISYVDTGTTGSTIDPTQLLYIGGTPIISNCMTQKDRTLFFGNITQEDTDVLKEVEEIIKSDFEITDYTIEGDYKGIGDKSTYYEYVPTLSEYNGRFMPGESYRCGIQVQFNNGKWSDPIWIGDLILCSNNTWNTPGNNRESSAIKIIYNQENYNRLQSLGVKRFRTCIVFPKAAERNVVCQGVLCPTVFGVSSRRINSPYSMSSWFFRPATDTKYLNNSPVEDDSNYLDPYNGASIQFQHNKALLSGINRGAEIQSMLTGIDTVDDCNTKELADTHASHFFVDENIVTFHSPDLEFDPYLDNYNWDNVYLKIIGIARLGAISGDMDIQTSTPTSGSYTSGFIKTPIGYTTKTDSFANGGLVMGAFYNDVAIKKDSYDNFGAGYLYSVYPWHRSGSLNNDARRPTNKGTQSALLSKKKLSNLKFFDKNMSLGEDTNGNGISPLSYEISKPQLFNSEELSVLKLSPYHLKKEVTYLGNVDTLVTVSKRVNDDEVSNNDYKILIASDFKGEFTVISTKNSEIISTSRDPVRIKYKSSPHLVFSLNREFNYNISDDTKVPITLLPRSASIGGTLNAKSFTLPEWDSMGELGSNNKHIYSGIITRYMYSNIEPSENDIGNYGVINNYEGGHNLVKAAITDDGDKKWIACSSKLYNNIILKVVSNFTRRFPKEALIPGTTEADYSRYTYIGKDKYFKITFNGDDTINLTQVYTEGTPEDTTTTTSYIFSQDSFSNINDKSRSYPHLLIGELVRNDIINKFGGTSEEALKQNLWLPASNPVNFNQQDINLGLDITVPFEFGDTWYSRYDCLKTYPYTQEDENSVIEIGSFMCETRVNIDGRYDKNRGQLSNITMNNTNFNLMNEVYFQKNNFFNYRIIDKDLYKNNVFPNQITWSKEKTVGEDVDSWSNITLASVLDVNGEMGSITSLETWNDYLLCFQDKAISQIQFNSRVAVPTSDGVPIEISNNYKVEGDRPISNNIGCKNKWSIVKAASGIYFTDSYNNNIYVFNGELTNLSRNNGLDWWSKETYTDESWCPVWFSKEKINGIRTFYDNKYGDIYITPGPIYDKGSIEQKDALCYSESLGQFTSLMSYGGVQAMFNYSTDFCSLKTKVDNNGIAVTKLYKNNSGEYNNFFDEIKGWDFSFISSQNPTITKIFDTVNLRGDCFPDNSTDILSHCPVNYIKVSNEYQDTGIVPINKNIGDNRFNNNFRKKFRVWRGSIPRSSKVAFPYSSHFNQDGVDVNRKYGRSRIRNPWAMITLGWSPDDNINTNERSEIHDVSVNYTV